jgi:hypothetical protein
MHITLSPAYGRDYKSKKAVELDFNMGKDFIIETFGHPYCGKPCSITDLHGEGITYVNIRYDRLRKVAVFKF